MKSKKNVPIEGYILDIARTIKLTNPGSDPKGLNRLQDDFSARLVLLRNSLASFKLDVTEALAQEISHDALKIGATKLLDVAIKMQGAARGGHNSLAEDLLNQMELEMKRIDDYFAEIQN